MSALDTILARAQPRPPALKADGQIAAPAWALSAAEAERYQIPEAETVEKQASLYTKLSWIQTAIEVVSQMAAGTVFQVYQGESEQGAVVKNHPFVERLRQPNELQDRFEFLEATFSYRRLAGNCYWWLNRTGPDAPPDEIWIIEPHRLQPVPDKRLYIKGYLYDAGVGKPYPLEPWEVCHFRVFHPLSKFVGLSAIESLRLGAYGDLAAQAWGTNFYAKDNAKVAGFLAFADPIEETRWGKLKADTAREFGGTKNKRLMMLRGVGQGGVQWIQTNLSQEDMQYLEGRQFTKEEIWGRLAPGLAPMLAINANEANARAGDATLRALAVWPAHQAVAGKITQDLLPAYGQGQVGAFEDVRHKDRMLDLQEQQAYERSHTIDEVRKKHYSDKPIGDDRGDLLPAEVGKGLTDARPPAEKPVPPPFGQVPPGQPPGQNGHQTPPLLPPSPEDALQLAGKMQDRRRWYMKVERSLRGGGGTDVAFDPDYLTDDEAMTIRAALKRAATADDVWRAVGG